MPVSTVHLTSEGQLQDFSHSKPYLPGGHSVAGSGGKGCSQKESRLRELIRYMFYSVQTESDSVQSADKLSALNI